MRGAIPPFPNTSSWRGAQLKNTGKYLPFTLCVMEIYILEVSLTNKAYCLIRCTSMNTMAEIFKCATTSVLQCTSYHLICRTNFYIRPILSQAIHYRVVYFQVLFKCGLQRALYIRVTNFISGFCSCLLSAVTIYPATLPMLSFHSYFSIMYHKTHMLDLPSWMSSCLLVCLLD
jgi:hypothetical protein